MENINIYDNFLTEGELSNCMMIIAQPNWSYGHTSSSMTGFNTPFWIMELNKYEFFTIHLKKKIETLLNKQFKIKRVYANGQAYGQDGSYHQDDTTANTYTFCIYLTCIENKHIDDAQGHIFFKLPDSKKITCIEPLYNRAIIFPSNYLHKGTSFCRYIQNMRVCIAFKLEEIQGTVGSPVRPLP